MKRKLSRVAYCLVVVLVLEVAVRVSQVDESASAKQEQKLQSRPSIVIACPGRLEGRAETTSVGAAIDGVVRSIYVREDQMVAAGEVLAEMDCNDLQSSLEVAQAEAESQRQARVRLLRGSRPEERQAAAQKTAAARAVLLQSAAQRERSQKLWDAGTVSRTAYEEAQRDYEVAVANLEQMSRNEALTNAGPLAEEVARADADTAAAENRIRLAQEKLSKCVVRAPINGRILRVHLREGESFALLAPRPLFSIADTSERRVRAEVDERDVGKVRAGQRVTISCDACGDRTFSGTVKRLSSIMGRRSVTTGDPADKSDRDVLEVVAELESDAIILPLGLRVTVQFLR